MLFPILVAITLAAAPEVKVKVVSTPTGAEVRLDDAAVGVTPLELPWPPGKKHTIAVSLEGGWSTEKRVVKQVKPDEQLSFVLVDVELKTAKKKLADAQARQDKNNANLEKLQRLQSDNAPDSLAAQIETAELAMQKAVEAVERAEEELALVVKMRKAGAPKK